ncbi:MAG: glucuronate isomerase [Solirubrobacteraceae bacterium]|nr:glucuronate isomerase [Solirubrobacteraceae bacterium]
MSALTIHPHILLPAGEPARGVAAELHAAVAELPIVSPHGHVDAALIARDAPFFDPAALLVTPDHYVTRLLHAHGVALEQLRPPAEPRAIWRRLCEHWPLLAGTVVRLWLELVLHDVLGVRTMPSAAAADELFDELSLRLAQPDCRPRALVERFGIELLATTDDPADDLRHHRALAADPAWSARVIPTFRPDAYLDPSRPDWVAQVARLAAAAGAQIDTYEDFVAALERRREHFARHGATSTDHGVQLLSTERLGERSARRIFASALRGTASADESAAFAAHMLDEMARMSCEDGLVMQLHPGVLRDHHPDTLRAHGANAGADIPLRAEFTSALRPLLGRYGTHARFRIVLFTVDESTFARELAPLAGFYPSVYVGAPWWFLDSPAGMLRFRHAVTDTIGFHRTSGFVDDARALCSIPARHDVARRVDCAFLAQLVCEHRLSIAEATAIARDLAVQGRRVFRAG